MSSVDFNGMINRLTKTDRITSTNNIDTKEQKVGLMGYGNSDVSGYGVTVERNVVPAELQTKFENVQFVYQKFSENTDFISNNDYIPDKFYDEPALCEA
ncbi:hypothetical protein HDR58_03950 [bacterium]|nr:hypothetical protein [bacterium]